MILVNNPAVWGKAYAPLQHAFWHGMTPTDLIYPFFVFIMGVSAFFSLSKRYEGADRKAFSRILRRSAVIFGVGLLLQEISYFGYGTANFLSGQTPAGATWFETVFPFRTFRIMGVLQGLALVYLFGSVALLCLRFRHLIAAAGGLLLLYLVLLQTGNGYSLSADNIIAVVDRAVLGESHLYKEWLPDGSRLGFRAGGAVEYPAADRSVPAGMRCRADTACERGCPDAVRPSVRIRNGAALCGAVAAIRRPVQQKDLEQFVRIGHFGVCIAAAGTAVLGDRPAQTGAVDRIFPGIRCQPVVPLCRCLGPVGYVGCPFN